MSFEYYSGVRLNQSTLKLQASVLKPARLVAHYDPKGFPMTVVGNSSGMEVSLKNEGEVLASKIVVPNNGLVRPFRFAGDSFPGTGGDCGPSLEPGKRCKLVLAFTPKNSGTRKNTLFLNYFAGVRGASVEAALTGEARLPAQLAFVGGHHVDFGSITLLNRVLKSFVLKNSGEVPATKIEIPKTLGHPFNAGVKEVSNQTKACSDKVVPGEQCEFTVWALPQKKGDYRERLKVRYHNGVTHRSAESELSAKAILPALFRFVRGTELDFGRTIIGTSKGIKVDILNEGESPGGPIQKKRGLAIQPFVLKRESFPGSCGVKIAGRHNCDFQVHFSPEVAISFNKAIELSYFDGHQEKIQKLTARGTGVTPAKLVIAQAPRYNFGPVVVKKLVKKKFNLSNQGQVAATDILPSFSGENQWVRFESSFPGEGGNCLKRLEPGKSCEFELTLESGKLGRWENQLALSYHNGREKQVVSLELKGNSLKPAKLVLLNKSDLDFGAHTLKNLIQRRFTFQNEGEVSVEKLKLQLSGDGFTQSKAKTEKLSSCADGNLKPERQCLTSISFAPKKSGDYNAKLTASYYNGREAVTDELFVAGKGLSPAKLELLTKENLKIGERIVGSVSVVKLSYKNLGQSVAKSIRSTIAGKGFQFLGGSYPGDGGNCGRQLLPLADCRLVVEFIPKRKADFNSDVTLYYFDGHEKQQLLEKTSAQAKLPGNLKIVESSKFDFGVRKVSTENDQVFTIKNVGEWEVSRIAMMSKLQPPFTFKGGRFPGEGGDCAQTLKPDSQCRYVISFSSRESLKEREEIEFNYFDGLNERAMEQELKGTVIVPAKLQFASQGRLEFGQQVNFTKTVKTIELANLGEEPAKKISEKVKLSEGFSYVGGKFPGVGGDCLNLLKGESECELAIQFSPKTPKKYASKLVLNYHDGLEKQDSELEILGEGIAEARLEVAKDFQFDKTTVLNSKRTVLNVKNAGDFPAEDLQDNLKSPHFRFYDGSYPGEGGTCGERLLPQKGCKLAVEFFPTAVGNHKATLQLSFNNGRETRSEKIVLSGRGLSRAKLALASLKQVKFKDTIVGDERSLLVEVENKGETQASSMALQDLESQDVFRFRGKSYPGTNGNCTQSLGPGEKCKLELSFVPDGDGPEKEVADFDFYDGVEKETLALSIQAKAILPAELKAIDDEHDFEQVPIGGNRQVKFTIQNVGEFSATQFGLEGQYGPFGFVGGSFPGKGGNCQSELKPKKSCQLVLGFAPDQNQEWEEELVFSYKNGLSSSKLNLTLEGEGRKPAQLVAKQSSHDFGKIEVGEEEEFEIEIENLGDLSAGKIRLKSGKLKPPFYFANGTPGVDGDCEKKLKGDSSCDVEILFKPMGSGETEQSFVLEYSNELETKEIKFSVKGTANPPKRSIASE